MNKIAIIGPVFPWRGGIAHHTASLASAFIKNGDEVTVFSFKRQYPKILYPGKSQKEIGDNPFPDIPTFYSIDTLNPLTWWKTYKAILCGNYSAVIFRYWHFYFIPCFVFIAFLFKKKIKRLCLIDNLFTHEHSSISKYFVRFFLNFIDLSVTQSDIVDAQFQLLAPLRKHVMLKHPTYNHFGPQISKIVARKQLGIPDGKKVLLFFGFIRHYKGLDLFLNILQEIRKKIPDIYLVVAGECFGSFESYQMIINANCLEGYIKCDIKYIQNSLIPIYFSSADIFLMPYRSATNSGVMEIAKYYRLPILASSIEAFKGQSDYHVNLVNINNATAVIGEINNIYASGLDRVNNDLTWEKFSQEIVRLI